MLWEKDWFQVWSKGGTRGPRNIMCQEARKTNGAISKRHRLPLANKNNKKRIQHILSIKRLQESTVTLKREEKKGKLFLEEKKEKSQLINAEKMTIGKSLYCYHRCSNWIRQESLKNAKTTVWKADGKHNIHTIPSSTLLIRKNWETSY